MLRTGLTALLLAFGAALAAPMAHADTAAFDDYLASNGVNESTPEMVQSNHELGESICNLFSAHADAGDSGRTTRLDAMDLMSDDTNGADAATWVVASVHYLCPRYVSMLS